MDAIEAMKTRRSVRAFTGEPVTKEQIEEIVDCGRLAANARNRQPWEFVAVTDPTMLKKLAGVTEGRGEFVGTAGVAIVVLGVASDELYVAGCSNAAQSMMIAAHAMGLGSCWAQLDNRPFGEKVRELVGAPDTFRTLCMLGIGYPMGLPDKPKRPLGEVLHWEKF